MGLQYALSNPHKNESNFTFLQIPLQTSAHIHKTINAILLPQGREKGNFSLQRKVTWSSLLGGVRGRK